MILLSLLAGLALLIATMGLYGMIAYVTSQRIREIGVRMALGAQRGDILALVVSQGMFLVLSGLAVGVAGASALTRFLSSILHGISPTDLPTFIGVAVLLALVALIACYLPGRRATKIDPMEALRYE
jgi:putative ABC transport system permease protein